MKAPSECPLCGAKTPFPCSREHVEGETRYTLYACDACKIQFWWPLKNPGAEWYSAHERYSGRNNDPVWGATWNHKKTISFLESHKGTLLDVGCGIGNFLVLAKERGWRGSGIDFDPDAIASAQKRTGLETLEVADVVSYADKHKGRTFGLVTFFDVLEHVDNHNEFIDSVRSLLAPRGYIAMSMPYRKHAKWLMPLDLPPGHLTYWDRTALTRFLNAHGFNVVYIARRSEGVWPIVMKLRFRFGKSVSFGAVNAVRRSIGDKGTRQGGRPFVVSIVQKLAKAKDIFIFGLPALLIWLVMLPSPRRYITLYAMARKTS